VTLVFAGRGDTPWNEVFPYIAVQCAAGIAGTILAHLMFDLAPLAVGIKARSGPSQWLSEAVATFSLVVTIFGGLRYAPTAIPWLVGLVITAAYWFTASTSFANPAVTLARGFTTTFAGIAINHVPAFIVAQLIGAATALLAANLLFPSRISQPAAEQGNTPGEQAPVGGGSAGPDLTRAGQAAAVTDVRLGPPMRRPLGQPPPRLP
jgi:glycerol uptake facilitator-like aquaporin